MTGKEGHMLLALCTGCGIGESLDTDHLVRMLSGEFPGLKVFTHPALCSADGLKTLGEESAPREITGTVIGACSPRVRQREFESVHTPVERVNLREQVAWAMEPGHEDTMEAAADQARMALAGMALVSARPPYIPEGISEDVLVVGGGMAGLTAALEGARTGRQVYLVEKSERLGGYAGRIWKALPGEDGILREPDTGALISEVTAHPGIRVYLETEVVSISGEPGRFEVVLGDAEKGKHTLNAGAVVTATGWQPYDAAKLGGLGYGLAGVMTLVEFEEHVADQQVPDRIAFILCAGSRDEDHLAYCSSYCCSAALKQAMYVRERNPSSQVYVIYRDIRTSAFQEDFYKKVQSDDAILMTKGTVQSVSNNGAGLLVEVKDSLLGEDLVLEANQVVLATGMVPSGTANLHLKYRQGEGLPELEYDFSDSHFICFPYETRRTGIYAAGTVRAPMDLDQCREDGAGAMMKAIQCIECVRRGEAVHPRSGDTSYPDLYMERCTDCKRCTEECPFGSYDETEKGTPLPNPARCRRCGICVGSCPERVIGIGEFSINALSAMITAVSMPDEFEEKPRILVLACENDAYPALDAAGINRLRFNPFVRILPVRCLGSVNKVWISDALSHGYDAILMLGCKPGDDYQCHFIQGSELTRTRGENLQDTLESMMLEPERIRTEFVEISDHHRIVGIMEEMQKDLDLMGPNPFKSM